MAVITYNKAQQIIVIYICCDILIVIFLIRLRAKTILFTNEYNLSSQRSFTYMYILNYSDYIIKLGT